MPTTIKLRNSVTTTNAPSSLVQGEVAINITDKKVWVGNAATTPIQLLGDGGSASFTSIAFGAGTVSSPSITFTGDTNTGIYSPAADTIAFAEGGVEGLRINSNGQTSTSIAGTASLPSFTRTGDENTGIFFPAADTIAFTEGGVESMRITDNGNVGIGTTSTSGRLHVAGGNTYLDGERLFIGGSNNNAVINNIASIRINIDSDNNGTGESFAIGHNQTSIDNNNILFLVNDSGNVGIGLSNPVAYTNFIYQTINGTNGAGIQLRNNAGTAISEIAISSASLELKTVSALPMIFGTSNTERMRIDSSGNVGIGTSSPGNRLDVRAGASALVGNFQSNTGVAAYIAVGDGTVTGYLQGDANQSVVKVGSLTNYPLLLQTNNLERMRIDSSGNVGIGTNSPAAASGSTVLSVGGSSSGTAGRLFLRDSANNNTMQFYQSTSFNEFNSQIELQIRTEAGAMRFMTANAERMRITSGGDLLVGQSSTSTPGLSNTTNGSGFRSIGDGFFSASGTPGLQVNRNTNDGSIISLRQDGTEEGTISVSGTTVSYNAFAGSHWSQLSDGSKPEILRGTVMESINELVEWEGEPTSERLCRVKVSDTASSKKVYGVFMCWDEDWTATNDMLVTSLGAFVCRVNKDVVVQEGDLLESNGDGTARVQADDIMRSSTIGKVTCTEKTHQYADGSYCVPTVLYCG